MFAIHTPQTIQLYGLKGPNGEPAESKGTITFQHPTEDVSKCQMIVAIEDRVYTFTFGTQGPIAETGYEDDATRKAAEEARKESEAIEAKRVEDQRAAADQANRHELRTADDTTAADISWDAPEGRQVVRDPPMIEPDWKQDQVQTTRFPPNPGAVQRNPEPV